MCDRRHCQRRDLGRPLHLGRLPSRLGGSILPGIGNRPDIDVVAVSLPAEKPAASCNTRPSSTDTCQLAGECLSRNKILVIDVDPVIRSGICDFLMAQGHIVAEAANSHDAQVQFEKFRPDAAILDFSFPNGDALQLLQRIKSADCNIPVIVLDRPEFAGIGSAGHPGRSRTVPH